MFTVYTQNVPVIFEPPCIMMNGTINIKSSFCCHSTLLVYVTPECAAVSSGRYVKSHILEYHNVNSSAVVRIPAFRTCKVKSLLNINSKAYDS